MLYKGHRTDVFGTFGNAGLYPKILDQYARKESTLVEAGD